MRVLSYPRSELERSFPIRSVPTSRYARRGAGAAAERARHFCVVHCASQCCWIVSQQFLFMIMIFHEQCCAVLQTKTEKTWRFEILHALATLMRHGSGTGTGQANQAAQNFSSRAVEQQMPAERDRQWISFQ